MPHTESQAFCVEIPVSNSKEMEDFQEAFDNYWDEHNKYIEKLAQELNVDEGVASDIFYVRGRSRWSPELENRIISAYRAGTPCPCVLSGEENEWLTKHGF